MFGVHAVALVEHAAVSLVCSCCMHQCQGVQVALVSWFDAVIAACMLGSKMDCVLQSQQALVPLTPPWPVPLWVA